MFIYFRSLQFRVIYTCNICAVMKSYAQNILQVLFMILLVGVFAIWQHKTNEWEYMVFTQQWPAASCVDINDTHEHTCFLTKNIHTWTIHGIWPNQKDSRGPFYCNNSWPFRESDILDLEPQLMNRWPNLMADTSKTSFWNHEWVKHGTCAASLPALNSEHKYFAMGLQLNTRFNFSVILAKHSITPSDTTLYQLADVRKALELFTKSSIIIQCIFSKDKSKQALIQVEVCLNKDFTTRDCLARNFAKVSSPPWDDIPYNPNPENCKDSLPLQLLPFNYAR